MNCGWEYPEAHGICVCTAPATTPVQSRVTGEVKRRCLSHAQADVNGGQWAYVLGWVGERLDTPLRGEQALQAVTRAWFEALDLLQRLVQDACVQSGPRIRDIDIDRDELVNVCTDARVLLYKYRGEV